MDTTQEITSEVTSHDLTDEQIDQYANATVPSADIPMNTPPKQEVKAPEFTLDVNGRQITADQDKMTKWAQMGYDYAQKMADFKQQQQDWQTQQQQFQEQQKEWNDKLNTYGEVDNFAKENPDWWEKVQSAYQQAKEETENPQLAAVKKELEDLKKFKEEFIQEKQNTIRQQEDTQLSQEIKSIRDQYSNLDWDSRNGEGMNLELQVIKHAQDNGISNFRAAFRDFNHDRLMSLAQDKAKEAVVSDTKARTKLGLLGLSQAPTGIQDASNIEGKSYEQLAQEALREIELLTKG